MNRIHTQLISRYGPKLLQEWLPAYFEELLRLLACAVPAYLLYNKSAAIGYHAIILFVICAVLLFAPHFLCNRLKRYSIGKKFPFSSFISLKMWVADRNITIKWVIRAFVFGLSLLLVLLPLPPLAMPKFTKTLLQDELIRPYDGDLTPDDRYIVFTSAHSPRGGIGRLDLTTGKTDFIDTKDDNGQIELLLPDKNLVIVNSHLIVGSDDDKRRIGYLYLASIEPFALIDQQRCPYPKPIRMIRYLENSLVAVSNDRPISFFVSDDFLNPCVKIRNYTNMKDHTDFWISGIDQLVLLEDEPDKGWTAGWQGGAICLIHPNQGLVLTCRYGGSIWDSIIEPGTDRLWLARHIWHKIDIRDTHTGELIKSIRVNGVARPMVVDPVERYLYAGLYTSKRIAVIDLVTDQVVNYVGSGWRIRKLLIDQHRRMLYAISAGGIFSYPLNKLHPARKM